MPPKTLVKAGVVSILLAVAVFLMTGYWLDTRTFKPVGLLVSLEAGKIQTVDFAINLWEHYTVDLTADYSVDDWTEGKCNSRTLSDLDWKVYRLRRGANQDRELWASSEEMRRQGRAPIGFRGLPGKYKLEWSVPDAAVCLNARHPRLRVWADPDAYGTVFELVVLACIFLAVVGIGAFVRAIVVWLQGILGGRRALQIFPEMLVRNVIPLKRHLPMPLMRDLPNFGIFYGGVLWILTIIFMIVTPRPSHGLRVDFREQKTVGVEKSPWTETMSVYADARRGFLVNGQPVRREELRTKVQDELLRRGIWVVYFEADFDCAFMDAAFAIDTIQGLGAKLIWITPRTREEWKRKTSPQNPSPAPQS
jgi:biopolymer transport protein ExbD